MKSQRGKYIADLTDHRFVWIALRAPVVGLLEPTISTRGRLCGLRHSPKRILEKRRTRASATGHGVQALGNPILHMQPSSTSDCVLTKGVGASNIFFGESALAIIYYNKSTRVGLEGCTCAVCLKN